MTKREMFAMTLEILATANADEEIIKGIQHELEMLDKKTSAVRKPSANQLENEVYKEAILTYLAEVDKPVTVSEIIEGCAEVSTLKNQRVTALLTQLKKAKRVTNSKEGKKSVYTFGYTEEV